jgi:hypothetical protein
LKSVTPSERLRLRDDVHRHMQMREWIFSRAEKDNRILLVDESGVFGWNIKIDDVDWEAYRRSKEEQLSPQAQTLQA